MSRRITITNVFGPMNRGDDELLNSLLELLPESADVVCLARDPEGCRAHHPEADFIEQPGKREDAWHFVPASLVRVWYLAWFLLSVRVRLAGLMLPASQRRAGAALRRADVIIACPGGYLEDSRLSLYSQIVQLAAARLTDRRLILAPMSVGPVQSPLAKCFLRWSLARAEAIHVRDRASLRFVERLGLDAKLSLDLAISGANSWMGASAAAAKPDLGYYVVTLLRWAFPTSLDPADAKRSYVERAVELVDELAGRSGRSVKLLVQVDGDRKVIDQVAVRCRIRPEIINPSGPNEVRQLVGGATGVVASRLHSGIFALQTRTPVVFLGYLPKSAGVLELIGLEDLVHPIETFVPSAVVEQLLALGEQPGAFASIISAGQLRAATDGREDFPDDLEDQIVEADASGLAGEAAEIAAVVVVPPPNTGMTAVSGFVAGVVDDDGGTVRSISRADGSAEWRWRLTKHVRYMVETVRALRQHHSTIYLVPDAGPGLWGTTALVGLIVAFGDRVVLHHHVYRYLDRSSAAFRLLVKIGGDQVGHIVLSEGMGKLLNERYQIPEYSVCDNTAAVVASMTDSVSVEELGRVRDSRSGPIRLGFLGRVSDEKGLGVLERVVGEAMIGQDAQLYIAGPCRTQAERTRVTAIEDEGHGRVHYLGPVHGREKYVFLAGLDYLLFPTQYANEAQPLVVWEAAAAGARPIGLRRGALAEQFADVDGLLLDDADCFVDEVRSLLQGGERAGTLDRAERAAEVRRKAVHSNIELGRALGLHGSG